MGISAHALLNHTINYARLSHLELDQAKEAAKPSAEEAEEKFQNQKAMQSAILSLAEDKKHISIMTGASLVEEKRFHAKLLIAKNHSLSPK